MPETRKPLGSVEVFCSYAHKDQRYRSQFEAHVALMKRQNLIQIWQDRKIIAGGDWGGEIDSHLKSADIITLFVSADFLSSDYCYDKELKRALQRHKREKISVVPIIIRPCDWHDAPFRRLQAIPIGGRPVTSYRNRDAAWTEVANYLKLTVKAVLQQVQRNLVVTQRSAGSATGVRSAGRKSARKDLGPAESKRRPFKKSAPARSSRGKQQGIYRVKTRDSVTPALYHVADLQERIDAIDREVRRGADQRQLDSYANWYKYIKSL